MSEGRPDALREGARSQETLAAGGVVRSVTMPSRRDHELAAAQNHVPETFELPPDRYQPIHELGRGGMGLVEVVFDRTLGRTVARKTVLEQRHRAFLSHEARVCSQLEHPSIVPVYDLGSDDAGNPVYTMRVVRGETLRRLLLHRDAESSGVGLYKLLGVLKQVCLAAEYAHTRGVIHRDLKPENIIVGSFGEVYVLDWGVAHVLPTSDLHLLGKGPDVTMVGSPGYLAPEQVVGGEIGPWTDIFAIGVILYELVAGASPFEDKNMKSIRSRSDRSTFPPPSLLARGPAPLEIDEIVRRCLRKDPKERPKSARELANGIESILDGERAKKDREREADLATTDGKTAVELSETLDREATRLREEAERESEKLSPWDSVAVKEVVWAKTREADKLSADAARALAQAEVAFSRALTRVPSHKQARMGLAALHYQQFLQAEHRRDGNAMAHYLDLAKAHDDGALEHRLADRGELIVETIPAGTRVSVHRWEDLNTIAKRVRISEFDASPTLTLTLSSGSYAVTSNSGSGAVFPVEVRRGQTHRVTFDLRAQASIPEGFVHVPRSTFVYQKPGSMRRGAMEVEGFAIARFPVTLGEYAAFLDTEDGKSRSIPKGQEPILEKVAGKWRATAYAVAGEARKRVPEELEMLLPASFVTWFDAAAYLRWKAKETGLPLRLPTDIEWDKAMRGADQRPFPMGFLVDPAFAKLRTSRPEATQPEPVGAFPLDESPYGVRDLAGGIGDWTASAVDGQPLPSPQAAEAEEGAPIHHERQAFWRGGNWGMMPTAHAQMRYPMKLSAKTSGVGFRPAMTIPEDTSSVMVEPIGGRPGKKPKRPVIQQT